MQTENATTLTWNSAATGGRPDTNSQKFEDFPLLDFVKLIRPGKNVLAIHGMNASLDDRDLLFDAELLVKKREFADAPKAPNLVINELSASDADSFFVEFANRGLTPLSLERFSVQRNGNSDSRFNFPADSLGPGDLFASQLGFTMSEGDQLLLIADDQAVLEGVRVIDRLQGKATDSDPSWRYPNQATPGNENKFAPHDEIVINEIMYHASPFPGVPDVPPTFDSTPLFPMTSQGWRREFQNRHESIRTG